MTDPAEYKDQFTNTLAAMYERAALRHAIQRDSYEVERMRRQRDQWRTLAVASLTVAVVALVCWVVLP